LVSFTIIAKDRSLPQEGKNNIDTEQCTKGEEATD